MWAEDWIMDHINGEGGRNSTRDAWLKMLGEGRYTQPDKVTSFMVGIKDNALRQASKEAFVEGLRAQSVKESQISYILGELFG